MVVKVVERWFKQFGGRKDYSDTYGCTTFLFPHCIFWLACDMVVFSARMHGKRAGCHVLYGDPDLFVKIEELING